MLMQVRYRSIKGEVKNNMLSYGRKLKRETMWSAPFFFSSSASAALAGTLTRVKTSHDNALHDELAQKNDLLKHDCKK